jgi:hypothetical protein
MVGLPAEAVGYETTGKSTDHAAYGKDGHSY